MLLLVRALSISSLLVICFRCFAHPPIGRPAELPRRHLHAHELGQPVQDQHPEESPPRLPNRESESQVVAVRAEREELPRVDKGVLEWPQLALAWQRPAALSGGRRSRVDEDVREWSG